jgi:hypothetical protein
VNPRSIIDRQVIDAQVDETRIINNAAVVLRVEGATLFGELLSDPNFGGVNRVVSRTLLKKR